eukprot:1144311-Pelagomonas_calceolata.AAC.5
MGWGCVPGSCFMPGTSAASCAAGAWRGLFLAAVYVRSHELLELAGVGAGDACAAAACAMQLLGNSHARPAAGLITLGMKCLHQWGCCSSNSALQLLSNEGSACRWS